MPVYDISLHRRMRRPAALGGLIVGALCAISTANAGRVLPAVRQAEDQAGYSAPSKAQIAAAIKAAATAHIELQRSLEAIVASKQQVMHAIDTGDLEAFRSRAIEIQNALLSSRTTLDRAVLNGVWKAPPNKRRAADLANSIQGAQILSIMTVAISAGYEYPTKKVPESAADAAVRLFDRVEQLAADVKALNQGAG